MTENNYNDFLKIYNVGKKELLTDKHTQFRIMCFKFNIFMKQIKLPKISLDKKFEAVLIEYRLFPHLEFLIRNAIYKLGSNWSFTVICGNVNYSFILAMCNKISPNVKVIKTNHDNLTTSEYSKLLASLQFWNLLKGEKILIYQEDSFIFKKNIVDFLKYDFIGAPFQRHLNDTPNSVGNGGLSLRTKKVMIKIISTISIEKTLYNSSTQRYMKLVNATVAPEDVYFSKNMQELKIGSVADWNTASLFSSETVFNGNSFGGHKFWLSDSNWKNRLKTSLNYNNYVPISNLNEYIQYKNCSIELNKTSMIPNYFDIDINFYKNANNVNINNNNILKHIEINGICGLVYHPKQIKNIYSNVKFFNFLNKVFVLYNNGIFNSRFFTNKFIYNKSFDEYSNLLIREVYNNLSLDFSNVLLLVFIGNKERGIELIHKIISYTKIQNFNISFCFNSKDNINDLTHLISSNFVYYSIHLSNEFGTDITPTMLTYNNISKRYKFEHIIKLHTKSITHQFNDLTNFLLTRSVEKLCSIKYPNCNCIGNPNYYMFLNYDKFNKYLINKYASQLNEKYCFVAGTIFYANASVFNKVVNFMKNNNPNSYILNNLYENNSINTKCSPIHFIERLFGIIKN